MLVLFASVWGLMQFLSSPLSLGVTVGSAWPAPGNPALVPRPLRRTMSSWRWPQPSSCCSLAGIISGITSATISTARACVADVSSPRAARPGIRLHRHELRHRLRAGTGDRRLPGRGRSAPAVLGLGRSLPGKRLLRLVRAPESLPPERRMAFSWKRANPVGALRLLLSQRELPSLATIHFLITLVQQVLPAVFVLCTAHRYGWDGRTIGLTLVALGLGSALVQGLLVGPIVDRLGSRLTLIVGLAVGWRRHGHHALAPSGHWFLVGRAGSGAVGHVEPGPAADDDPPRDAPRSKASCKAPTTHSGASRPWPVLRSSAACSPGHCIRCRAHPSCSQRSCWPWQSSSPGFLIARRSATNSSAEAP